MFGVYSQLNPLGGCGQRFWRLSVAAKERICAKITESVVEISFFVLPMRQYFDAPAMIRDSLGVSSEKFCKRAGNIKMATLATYFGLGQQKHRSLDDVRMNLEVLMHCATVLFLESSLPNVLTDNWKGDLGVKQEHFDAEFWKTGLERTKSLEIDLEWFMEQGHAIPEPSSAGLIYAQYLEDLAEKDPQSFFLSLLQHILRPYSWWPNDREEGCVAGKISTERSRSFIWHSLSHNDGSCCYGKVTSKKKSMKYEVSIWCFKATIK